MDQFRGPSICAMRRLQFIILSSAAVMRWNTSKIAENREATMSAPSFDQTHASSFPAFQKCPNCRETIFSAAGAAFLPEAIKYNWHCDLCDHHFQTVEVIEQEDANA